MLSDNRFKILELVLTLILGVTFIYASIHKILAPGEFAKIVYGYDLFPGDAINLIAIIIPFLEFFCGVFLILHIYPRAALFIINSLIICFILMLGYNIIRGHEFDCGCFSFGTIHDSSGAVSLVVRDIGLLACGLFLWFKPSYHQS